MESIAVVPAPPSPNQPGVQTQMNRSDGKNSFAPTLKNAIKTKNEGPDHEKSLTKTDTSLPEKVQKADDDKSPSEPTDTKSLITEKPSEDTDETPKNSDKTTSNSKESPSSFTVGISAYIFTSKENFPSSGLQQEMPTSFDSVATAKKVDTDLSNKIFQDISNLVKDSSVTSQQKNELPAQKSGKILSDFASAISQQKNELQTQSIQGNNIQDILDQKPQTVDVAPGPNAILSTAKQDPSTGLTNILANIKQPQTGTGQDTLLTQQLQQILSDNGQQKLVFTQQPDTNNQTINLQSLSTPLLTVAQLKELQPAATSDVADDMLTDSIVGMATENWFPGEKATDKSSASDKNLHGELLFTKDVTQDKKEATAVQEKDSMLQNSSNRGQTGLNSFTSPDNSGSSQQAAQFSLASTLTQNVQNSQNTASTTWSNFMSQGTTLYESSLLNQVMQHFQVNSSAQASKMVLKLYPEELGELKIDIQLKDGSIKANIVTQNQQVQQVLEKYIPKLKAFMEQQGLTVDDILVTNQSNDVGKHDLFQQDFADSNDFSSSSKSTKSPSFIDLSLEKAFSEKTDTVSGVNVTI
jgi:flagellar hook-length control protein FliK